MAGFQLSTEARILRFMKTNGAVGVQEPMWETRSGYDGEDEYEYEELYRTLLIDEAEAVRIHLDALEACRRVASLSCRTSGPTTKTLTDSMFEAWRKRSLVRGALVWVFRSRSTKHT